MDEKLDFSKKFKQHNILFTYMLISLTKWRRVNLKK